MGLVDNKIKQKEYIAKANQTEQKYGLPTNLLVGLLKTESNFDPEVISGRRKSSAGAIGIAQFMPGTAKDFGIDPRNVDQSIDAAGKYLSQNYKKLGDWDDTLRSYNMGLGNVYKWKQGKMKLPKETAEYVGKVYANMGGSGEYYGGADQGYKPQSYTTPQYAGQFINYGEGNYANTPTGVASEDTKEEAEAKQTIDKVTAEQQSMQEYFAQQQQATPQREEQYQQPVESAPSLLEQYGQVSQFVDFNVVQEGGSIPISNRGVYEVGKQPVLVPTNGSITMSNVEYPILGISVETGEKKLMLPEEEHFFKNTKHVFEIPQLNKYFNKYK